MEEWKSLTVCVMLEGTTEEGVGMIDSYHRTDGKGLPFLHIKAGGSVCPSSSFTIDHRLHYTYQEGRTVFRYGLGYGHAFHRYLLIRALQFLRCRAA